MRDGKARGEGRLRGAAPLVSEAPRERRPGGVAAPPRRPAPSGRRNLRNPASVSTLVISMPRPDPCLAFDEVLPALAAGETCDPAVAGHADACEACASALRRERRLVAMLRALPAAPAGDIPVPALPALPGDEADAAVRRFRVFRLPAVAAALAAAVLAAVAVGIATRGGLGGDAGDGASGDAGTLASAPALVGDLRIVDTLEFSAGPDDRLLAITGGPEAVAARHSASAR